MKYAALCCIAKDEDAFLKEWLACHSLMGFEHFIIYDNQSNRPIADLLEGFAGPDSLTILRGERELAQQEAYDHCLAEFGGRFKWIAFLDLDEFIRISAGRGLFGDVREFLAAYEPYAGLGLNWRMFSSAGHEKRPDGPVIANYTRWYLDAPHMKSIVQPGKTAACAGPHSFTPRPGRHAVNADHFPIPPGFPACLPALREACVNHYFFKSRECFQAKIDRGNPCNIERRMEEFDRHLDLPAKEDAALAAFAVAVRQALAVDRLPLPEAPSFAFACGADRMPEAMDYLAGAREHLKKDNLRQANLCLSYAAMCNDARQAGGGFDPLLALEIWTLRAVVARKRERYDLAERYLRQAFIYGASVQAHTELANVLLNTGRAEESKHLVDMVRNFKTL